MIRSLLVANGTRIHPAAVAPYLAAAPIRRPAPHRSLPFIPSTRPGPETADLAVLHGDAPICRVTS